MTIDKEVRLLRELVLLFIEDARAWEPGANGPWINEIVKQLRNDEEETKDE